MIKLASHTFPIKAAIAKMTKNIRRIVTDVSVALLSGFGWLF